MTMELTLEQIQNMSSGDRMQELMKLRSEAQKRKLSESEVRFANRLLRAERGARVENAGKRKKAEAKPSKPVPEFDLGAIVRGEDPIKEPKANGE